MTFIAFPIFTLNTLFLHSLKDDSKLLRGYYAFATTWNSFFKTSTLIKCQSDVFRIVWHRSTSLCESRVLNLKACFGSSALYLFLHFSNHPFMHVISRDAFPFYRRDKRYFRFSLSRAKNSKQVNNCLSVTASRCLREQTFFT